MKSKLDNIIKKFNNSHLSKDKKLYAILLENNEKVKTWHFIKKDFISKYINIVNVEGKLVNANLYKEGTHIYNSNGSKSFKKKSEYDSIIATVINHSKYGKTWHILQHHLFIEYDNQDTCFIIREHQYFSHEYRVETLIVEDKYTGFKYLTNLSGKIVMKVQYGR